MNLILRILDEIPEVCYVGNPILRRKTEEVSVEEGKEIAERLRKVLVKYREVTGMGRGLAAPQIGLSKAVFITYIDDKLQTYINPKITKRSSGSNLYRELCLSSGIMWADVERAEKVTMEWVDESGQHESKDADGFLARLWQHEEAHLRGKCNLDEAVEGTIEFALDDPFKEKLRRK